MRLTGLTSGVDEPCPYCRSRNVRFARPGELSHWYVTSLTAPRKCELCGQIFEPRSSRGLALGVVCFGLAMLVCAGAFLLGAIELWNQWGSTPRYVLSALGACGGLMLTSAGLRALRSTGAKIGDAEEE